MFIMIWQTKNIKKISLIVLSVVLGGGAVFGAGVASGLINIKKIEESSNEWRDGLSVVPGGNTTARVKKGDVKVDNAAFQATTTTDIISRKLLVEYALSQKGTATSAMSDKDAQNIASILSNAATLPPKKEYTLNDLNISKDNSYDANLVYASALSTRLKKFVATGEKGNELTILLKAVDADDNSALALLDARIIIYQTLIKDLLALKTPSNITPVHLRLIQGYETMRNGTVGFKKILSDPALGVASLAEYRKGVDILSLAEKDLRGFNFSKQ